MTIVPRIAVDLSRVGHRFEAIRRRGCTLLASATSATTDLVLPASCVFCGIDLVAPVVRPYLCRECCAELRQPTVTRCRRCAARVGIETSEEGCVLCRDAHLKFDHVTTLGSYEGPLRDAVLRMKRSHNEGLSMAIADLLAQSLECELAALPIDVVVAVPMHWRRRLWRATNNPEILAHAISRHLQRPLSRRALRRPKSTQPQAKLSPRDRRSNVHGAFRVAKGSDWKGARVLLVDDILTTGATCSEISAVLKQAGASCVNVVVAARAQGHL